MREQAEPLLAKIDRYLEAPLNQDVAARLIENKNGIVRLLSAMHQKHFSAVFIGKIGVGKTSAICKVSDLQYGVSDNEPVEVLKTGAGRTSPRPSTRSIADLLSMDVDLSETPTIKLPATAIATM